MKLKRDQMTFEFLSECFSLNGETGSLTWLERPRGHFSSRRSMSFFNSHTAGKEAGNIKEFRGYKKFELQLCGLKIPLHRVIYALSHGIGLGEVPEIVDHADGNSLNNAPSNLRAASFQQSTFNRGLSRTNTSGHKGVIFTGSAWAASIKINYRSKRLGSFATKEEAAAAYMVAAKNAHGEFYREVQKPADAAA